MASKIVKSGGAEATEFELSVAQELFNLEVKSFTYSLLYLSAPLFSSILSIKSNDYFCNNQASAADMKADLHSLYISAAKEMELDGGRKAIIIFVPFRQLKDFHKIQARMVRELEKKFR